ncbi:hypothetical protein LCGC14_0563180 [marine sediment metagenome]|uniref:ABC transporter substrate-binding protein n=2 Tax=root TaxID=1 RepID=A0A0F9S544_9ZZZZ
MTRMSFPRTDRVGLLLLGLLAGSLCTGAARAGETRFASIGPQTGELTIASVTDLAVISPLLEAFHARQPGLSITYIEETSLDLDRAVRTACDAGRFFADLVVSSAIAEQVRLVNDGCSQPLTAPIPTDFPAWAKWRRELVGLTFEPAVIVYNRTAIAPDEVPRSRFELVDLLRQSDRFLGRVGTYDIEKSGVGYLFAFEDATLASTWGRLLENLGRNRAQLFCCTADILDRVADGRLDIGYNVLGSYALGRQERDDRFGIVYPSDYTLTLSRAAFVPRHAENAEMGNAFIAFTVSPEGQQLLSGASNLFAPGSGPLVLAGSVEGAAADATLEAFRPIALTPALLASLDRAKRALFLGEWRKAFGKGAE